MTTEAGREKLALRPLVLRVTAGPDEGRTLEVAADPLVIGSARSCELALRDPRVSGRHVEIALDEDGFLLRDLGSKNGVYVNGLRAQRIYLSSGCTVELGRSTIEVLDAGRVEEYELSARRSYGRLAGDSLPMRRLFAALESAAATELTVLLGGETGTGKGLVAEEIHRHSARADGPFEVFDCGAVPPELIEAQLFGHERGAFTGAVERGVGVAERANGGTLFLDEIGELPLALQPKLLRLVEQRQYVRVGDPRRRSVDVRFIAATNIDLERAVAEGTFREDLFFRLAVMRLRLPALRERLSDLPLLVDHLAKGAGVEVDLTPLLPLLGSYRWPGNIRELRNFVERLALLPPDEALPTPIRSRSAEQPFDYQQARDRAISEFEQLFVKSLLRHTGGNVSKAAKLAGLSRRYLTQLIAQHNIDRRREAQRPEGG